MRSAGTDQNDAAGEGETPALDGYSLPALAGLAGLRSVKPLERLARSPRYQERLSRFAAEQGIDAIGGSDAARGRLLRLSLADWQTLFSGLGLCWGLARLIAALTPADIARIREIHEPAVIQLAHDGLARVSIAPAMAVSPGLEGISPDNCRHFGRMVFLGWLAESHPDMAPLLRPVLGAEYEADEPRRLAALDPVIEAFLNGPERAQG